MLAAHILHGYTTGIFSPCLSLVSLIEGMHVVNGVQFTSDTVYSLI